ncbi:MAG TPA: hypothetical protein DIT07_08390 [Sphingobacteriaceae bacterium]|nr:hypothetical protein [Sphingobacteriaceae bacterium]
MLNVWILLKLIDSLIIAARVLNAHGSGCILTPKGEICGKHSHAFTLIISIFVQPELRSQI